MCDLSVKPAFSLQDTSTAAVVGNSSYNELLARLTTADLAPTESPQPAAGAAADGVAEAAAAQISAPAASSSEASGHACYLCALLYPNTHD